MLGERDAARVADEKRARDLLFQPNHLGTDRRLTQMQPTTGPGKAPSLRNGDERVEERGIERMAH
ncbi:hypothetical protein BGC_43810 [Burkholderia sp. 3C]